MARLAYSLVTLARQLDVLKPDRPNDGWIGDAAHASRGGAAVSQHNPNEEGVVCALDVYDESHGGVNVDRLMTELDASNDQRIFYLIHDSVIDNSDDTRTAYNGVNPHKRHLHISVRWGRPDLYDDPRPWNIPMLKKNYNGDEEMRLLRNSVTGRIFLVTSKGLTHLKGPEEVNVIQWLLEADPKRPFNNNARFEDVLKTILARECVR